MIVRIVLFISFISFISFANANPYKELDVNIKLNIMVNHFLNKDIKGFLPTLPKKPMLKDDDANLDPIKYEQYFNYIQRLKAIRESRQEEQDKIDEKYAGQLSFYNGKLKSLKKAYTKIEDVKPILQSSINKAFKVVYGQPKFKDLIYDVEKDTIYGYLSVEDIYAVDKFKDKKISIYLPKYLRKVFLKNYESIEPVVHFKYEGDEKLLSFDDVVFTFQSIEYTANFVDTNNEKIKLDVKINDDIFRLVKIKDKK